MSYCWHLLVLLVGIPNVISKKPIFNVDTENPIIFRPRSNEDTDRFGQGLAIQEDVAIVGAPKADTHGKIFTCDYEGKLMVTISTNCYTLTIIFGSEGNLPG